MSAPPKKREHVDPTVPVKSEPNGEIAWEISPMRRVTVRAFSGKKLIDIREYYQNKATGEAAPGKKGISLTEEQWENLKKIVSLIDSAVKDLKVEGKPGKDKPAKEEESAPEETKDD